MRLRPFKPGDEDAFELREDFAEERCVDGWNWSKGPPGPTWTLLEGDQVLGIGGAFNCAGDAWQAWAQLSDLDRRCWPEAARLARVVLEHLAQRHGARRIWAHARTTIPAAYTLLRRLGFEAHCVMPVKALGCDVMVMLREG